MTIDKVICKDFKSNPIIDYGIFINHILPYINNIYLNNKEKNKRLLSIFKNDTKKYITEAFGKGYQPQSLCDEEDSYYGIGFLDSAIDEDHDVYNSITITIQSKLKQTDIDVMEDIIYNENKINCYHLELLIWSKNTNLTNNSIKIFKNYLKNKLNKKSNNTILTYFAINKLEEQFFGSGQLQYMCNIQHTFDKTNDEWKQFKNILIEQNFNKDASHCTKDIQNNLKNICNKEINILKNIFLDKILSIFN